MKTITLKQAYDLLDECFAIILDENSLIYPILSQLTDDEENEFLYLEWRDEKGTYNVKFKEINNRNVDIAGSFMFLVDAEGYKSQLRLLVPAKLT